MLWSLDPPACGHDDIRLCDIQSCP
jgi:hypothetical protein